MVTFYPYFISCDTVSTVDQVIGEFSYWNQNPENPVTLKED